MCLLLSFEPISSVGATESGGSNSLPFLSSIVSEITATSMGPVPTLTIYWYRQKLNTDRPNTNNGINHSNISRQQQILYVELLTGSDFHCTMIDLLRGDTTGIEMAFFSLQECIKIHGFQCLFSFSFSFRVTIDAEPGMTVHRQR